MEGYFSPDYEDFLSSGRGTYLQTSYEGRIYMFIPIKIFYRIIRILDRIIHTIIIIVIKEKIYTFILYNKLISLKKI